MHDPWIEKLSDHIDGLLGESEERDVLAHLDACAECREIADELRSVVAAAHAAPVREPERDLWPAIAARLGESTSDSMQAPARRVSRFSQRFSFSMPQLAAAAVVLMAVSGAAVWSLTARRDAMPVASGTIIQSAGSAAPATRLVSTTTTTAPAGYIEDVAQLERALEQNSAQLDPATVEIVRRSLETINAAIADARAALDADPGNPFLHRQLDNTMQKKIDVLRRATGVRRGQS